ncbi:hypothetical protein AVEN_14552-1 [Araneus ventricosus]|uniref:Endonuclease/exonuclease/phosphatase domain-containing protein n=1 Tax=Araneus ventricosus TaxID=182803 RepID=A0A4Y2CFG9_ARAVE|nr:hypothetical protein AVEN_14552-1 [Araneus ventricosus]
MGQPRQVVLQHKIYIILAQEPYLKKDEVKGMPQKWKSWTCKNGKASIILSSTLKPTSLSSFDNIFAMKIVLNGKPCTIISAYASPLEDIEPTLMEIHYMAEELNGEDYIIGAHLNGHHTSWGYNDTSPRRRAIEILLNAKQMILLNPIDTPYLLPYQWYSRAT